VIVIVAVGDSVPRPAIEKCGTNRGAVSYGFSNRLLACAPARIANRLKISAFPLTSDQNNFSERSWREEKLEQF
jgi:hypothetical protein